MIMHNDWDQLFDQEIQKDYSEFINEFHLSEITYENAGLTFLEILSKEFMEDKISIDEYMENFYYLYYIPIAPY